MSCFLELPNEIKFLVFHYSLKKDLYSLAHVSKDVRILALDVLKHRLCARYEKVKDSKAAVFFKYRYQQGEPPLNAMRTYERHVQRAAVGHAKFEVVSFFALAHLFEIESAEPFARFYQDSEHFFTVQKHCEDPWILEAFVRHQIQQRGFRVLGALKIKNLAVRKKIAKEALGKIHQNFLIKFLGSEKLYSAMLADQAKKA